MCPSMSIALATELDRCQFKQDSNGKIEVLKSSVESFYVKLYFDQCIAMSFFVTCMQCYCSKYKDVDLYLAGVFFVISRE